MSNTAIAIVLIILVASGGGYWLGFILGSLVGYQKGKLYQDTLKNTTIRMQADLIREQRTKIALLTKEKICQN